MNASDFWKNFRLGEEVHVAGSFIYNGLRRFHELQQLDHTDEIFEFLYNLSVGLERLLKIAVVLLEHTDSIDQQALEQSLITHSHLDLLARVRKYVPVNLSKPAYELLQLLSRFYKTLRYDRFSLGSVYEGKKEAKAIRALLSKYLSVEFLDSPLLGTPNKDRYRAFISRTVLKISRTLFKIINERSSMLGLYTYELRHGSKAESVFLREVEIGHEDVLWKELLIFFMNVNPSTGYLKFLKDIEPLDFDPALVNDYLDSFKSDALKAEVMDELESLYEDLEPKEREQRLKIMEIIGALGVYFDDPEDDEFLKEDEQFDDDTRS
ncbi:hypothetical protein ABZR71_26225 [Pseudomonas paraeruginosa]|uniref:hypothetical protein n=1 Tax=Pseudomonas aeruginosa group TaxID=136841 RepID=UPI0005143241|nr:hypothetical protein [Pseudomonas aeruginosa]KHE57596.1 hypothetical protein D407_0222930 [Pseudomonas aeruginosa]KSF81394.1 hypothetical protein AO940_06745 [Pseudomonas aeruginosa]MBF1865036.1 hypothetical protein [Pseudomonas aeruginosa]MBL7581331.1 hypothetical protein [Pseudomonas aeruginosa]MCT4804945.1 hypothetical protein [Pseudomonas aeruginosa]